MQLLSLNIGHPRPNDWDRGVELTGIDKRPVDHPVAVAAPGPKGSGAVGLAGDRVYDVDHHGGDDQAVYAYSREDYEYWEGQLGRALRPGAFGENLTTSGIDINNARIGERWRIGDEVVLEVSCPRIPCGTFRGWIAEKGWVKTFTAAERTGAYLRVINPGEIRAGDDISIDSRPDHDVTIALTFRALRNDRSLLPRLAAASDALPAETVREVENADSQGH